MSSGRGGVGNIRSASATRSPSTGPNPGEKEIIRQHISEAENIPVSPSNPKSFPSPQPEIPVYRSSILFFHTNCQSLSILQVEEEQATLPLVPVPAVPVRVPHPDLSVHFPHSILPDGEVQVI